jgi:hypothetical protein
VREGSNHAGRQAFEDIGVGDNSPGRPDSHEMDIVQFLALSRNSENAVQRPEFYEKRWCTSGSRAGRLTFVLAAGLFTISALCPARAKVLGMDEFGNPLFCGDTLYPSHRLVEAVSSRGAGS